MDSLSSLIISISYLLHSHFLPTSHTWQALSHQGAFAFTVASLQMLVPQRGYSCNPFIVEFCLRLLFSNT